MSAGRMLAGKSLFSRRREFHPEKMRLCSTSVINGMSNSDRLRAPIRRRRTETSIIYDEFSLSGSVDYTLDADRSTLRLSTGCPMQIYIKSPTADTLVGYAPIDHDIQSSHKGQC